MEDVAKYVTGALVSAACTLGTATLGTLGCMALGLEVGTFWNAYDFVQAGQGLGPNGQTHENALFINELVTVAGLFLPTNNLAEKIADDIVTGPNTGMNYLTSGNFTNTDPLLPPVDNPWLNAFGRTVSSVP
jgi:hypothetical protein